MTMEHALIIINNMQNKNYKSPSNYYNKKKINFEYQSYKRTAINEIKMYLMAHKDEDPITTVEEFRYMADNFACCTKNGSANFMFSVYYDVSTDVLDVLLTKRLRKRR